jgi:hypothetical protein
MRWILNMINRKNISGVLASIMIPLSGVSLAVLRSPGPPREGSRPRQIERTTVNKEIQTGLPTSPCQEDAIKPNVQLQLKGGQIFRYETIKAGMSQPAASGTKSASGRIVLSGEPIPFKQTIKIGGTSDYEGERCLSVEREALLANPSALSSGSASDRASKDRSRSFISLEGKIRSWESETTVTDGQSTSVNTNTESDFPASRDLHYFYGYWMLALAPGFSWECLKTTSEGQTFKKLRVTGMERIGGRECFVVERTTRTEAGETDITTYWVDKDKRIAVQVKKGGYVIRLLS